MRAITSWKSTWDTVLYFGINGLSMILSLWFLLHLLSKLLAIQDHTQNLEEQLWMGERREVSIIFYRPVTMSDLKQERSFFRGSVSTFLQLVVAIVYITVVRVWIIHCRAPWATMGLKRESGGTFCLAQQPSIYRLVVHRRNCGHSCQWIRSSRSNYSLIHGSSFSVCWSWRPW